MCHCSHIQLCARAAIIMYIMQHQLEYTLAVKPQYTQVSSVQSAPHIVGLLGARAAG